MTRRVIGATTRLVVLLGHPVAHSVSPAMHNAAFAAAGLDWVYVAADVAPDDDARAVGRAVAGLAALGAAGANVTVPYKRAALAACDDVTPRARAVGAVNTLAFGPGGVRGDNTDVAGFRAGLPREPVRRAVVLGAGGAARAVVAAVAGPDAAGDVGVVVVARDAQRARPLVDLGDDGRVSVRTSDDAVLADVVADADLVVNATPLGWHGERLPDPFHALGPGQVAYDLNYGDDRSPFLVDAAAAGATAVDGLAMVVGQAAAAFETWTGVVPDAGVMAAAARASRSAGRATTTAAGTATTTPVT